MPKASEMVNAGMFAAAAGAVNGSTETNITATAAGTITSSIALTATLSVITSAAVGSGVRMLAIDVGDTVQVKNLGAAAVNVFPPFATDVINTQAAGAAFALAAGGNAFITRVNASTYITA